MDSSSVLNVFSRFSEITQRLACKNGTGKSSLLLNLIVKYQEKLKFKVSFFLRTNSKEMHWNLSAYTATMILLTLTSKPVILLVQNVPFDYEI